MKIALLTSTYPPYRGGIGSAAFHEARGLALRGHDVTVLTPAYRGRPTPPPSDLPSPRVLRVRPGFAWGNAATCPGLLRAAREADVLLLHYPFFGVAERLPGRRHARPFVLRYDMDVAGRGLLGLVFRLHARTLLPRILRSAASVVFSSREYAVAGLANRFAADCPTRCAFIPYGFDPEVYHPRPDLPRGANILFVGGLDRAHYFKGVDRLIAAFARIAPRYPTLTLTVAGNGERAETFHAQACAQGVGDRVLFRHGASDAELAALYASSLLTVLPSIDRSESFGIVVLESMACGTPAAVSDLPGVRTLVRDGETGWRLDPPHDRERHIASLAEVLSEAAADPAACARMGAQAQTEVHARYTWAAVCADLEAVLADATSCPMHKERTSSTACPYRWDVASGSWDRTSGLLAEGAA